MDIDERYYPYSKYLKKRYGEKVYKLPVNLPVRAQIVFQAQDVHSVQKPEPDLKQCIQLFLLPNS